MPGKREETHRPPNAAGVGTKAAATARPADTSTHAKFAAEPTQKLDTLAPVDRPRDCWQDLHWWNDFLPKRNGIPLILRERPIRICVDRCLGYKGSRPSLQIPGLATASSPGSMPFRKTLSRHHREKDINFKEMRTVLLAIQHWLPHFKLHKLVIFTDNATVYHGLRRCSVQGPAMDPLREITHIAANATVYHGLRHCSVRGPAMDPLRKITHIATNATVYHGLRRCSVRGPGPPSQNHTHSRTA